MICNSGDWRFTVPTQLLRLFIHIRQFVGRPRPWGRDTGQATTEYALVVLAAALLALLLISWVTAGGGAERITGLFNRVFDRAVDGV
jgi:hypothetical protein